MDTPKEILIVEDHDIHGRMMFDVLASKGYKPTWVKCGEEALSSVSGLRPDLILMDMQLPDLSGDEVVKRLKSDKSLQNTPILAVTAFASDDDKNIMIEAGCCGFISKPFDVIAFLEQVSDILG
jgi:two-component system, cell cycle response regulator DivK